MNRLVRLALAAAALALTLTWVWPPLLAGPPDTPRAKQKSAEYWQRYKQGLESTPPGFGDVSVHDPSVIRVGDEWYLFGSHLAAAKTTNLMHWTRVADGVNTANPLFDNVVSELRELFDWSGSVGLWANDVIQLGDGRFYMYPNLSQGDAPRASLALAIADDVEGPYVYQGIFLQSGMWGQISEDGVNIYEPKIHPNTIDPDAFFDAAGKFWMVYGSYSGGIFILEMDPVIGLPLPGQGYGKHLMGGNHSRIEGPYILYSPDTGYYYLFVTFGGLAANGGYNMRVARSRDPDGPYFDALGNDMAEVKSDPDLPLFDDASIAPYGQKLMGNFRFLKQPSEPGSGSGIGYVSPGHNSAFYDLDSGRYFLVFHTRFPGQGELHQVRVHELFFNADGWPVVAPHRFVPEQFIPWRELPGVPGMYPYFQQHCAYKGDCWNARSIGISEVPGDYKLINHGKDITASTKLSERVTLQSDGGLSGAQTGEWQRHAFNRIAIELDDVGHFEGVLSRGWNETSQRWVVTFTAQSLEGVSIWGSRLAE